MKKYGNYRKIEELAHAKGALISDEEFFTSIEYMEEINGEVQAMLRRFSEHPDQEFLALIDWEPNDDNIGYTDYQMAHINAANPFFSGLTRWERSIAVHGIVKHEVGHKLYTDGDMLKKAIAAITEGSLYPQPDIDFSNITEILQEKRYMNTFLYFYRVLENSMEDGYIEERLIEDFPHPVHTHDLLFVRKHQYETFPPLEEMIKNENCEEDKFITICNLVLSYAKYGCIKCPSSSYKDERVQALFSCIPYIEKVKTSRDSIDHMKEIHNVIALLQDYLAAYIEAHTDLNDDELASSMGAAINTPQEIDHSSLVENTPMASSGKAGSNDNQQSQRKQEAASSGEQEKETESEVRTKSQGKSAENKENASSTANMKESSEKSEKETKSGNGSGKEQENGSKIMESTGNENTTEEGDGSLESCSSVPDGMDQNHSSQKNPPRLNLPDLKDPRIFQENSILEEEMTFPERNEGIKEETDRLLKKIATKKAEEQLEKEQVEALKDFNQHINYDAIHSGISCIIQRDVTVTDFQKQEYEQISAVPLKISQMANKNYQRVMRELGQEERQVGLYFGQRFYSPSITRRDKKYFASNRLPSLPSMSVGVVIDESGSMNGDRITAARLMAVMLQDFCESLDIRISIIGHHVASSHKVTLHIYSDFDSYDKNDRYRLSSIHAGGCNRDGYALRFMEERLKKEDADVKLLFIISDGQPADDNYYGTVAFDDLKYIKKDCIRNHIILIAAAIGDDKETIQNIYGNSYLDISDLDALPHKMISLIKRHLSD